MIVTAKIEKLENGKLVLKPDVDISRFLAQKRPRRVEVRLDDGRTISADQRRKIFAIIRDISLWSGQEPEELRLYLEWDFCSRCLREWFSLSNCDMTTAREFITYLIQFCFHWGVPTKDSLLTQTDDIGKYLYPPRKPIVNDLLYSGTYLFVGAPKVGKSFFMGQLAYHVAMGLPLWEYEVHQGTVLYLALEDDYARLQRRLSRMFGVEETSNLYFATQAKSVSEGLDQQLEGFIREHPDVRLIIIDTLQKVREIGGDRYSYASDYEIVTKLKTFSDRYGICLLVVHHTRKMEAEDSFDMISGTNGLLGAADGAFIMQKKRRTDNTALLDIVGRDQPDQELTLEFNRERCVWEFQGAETELWKLPPDPLLEAVAKMLTPEQPEWSGTPTELLERLPGVSIQANILTRKLNVSADRLYNDYGIRYESKRTHEGRVVKLTLENSGT